MNVVEPYGARELLSMFDPRKQVKQISFIQMVILIINQTLFLIDGYGFIARTLPWQSAAICIPLVGFAIVYLDIIKPTLFVFSSQNTYIFLEIRNSICTSRLFNLLDLFEVLSKPVKQFAVPFAWDSTAQEYYVLIFERIMPLSRINHLEFCAFVFFPNRKPFLRAAQHQLMFKLQQVGIISVYFLDVNCFLA